MWIELPYPKIYQVEHNFDKQLFLKVLPEALGRDDLVLALACFSPSQPLANFARSHGLDSVVEFRDFRPSLRNRRSYGYPMADVYYFNLSPDMMSLLIDAATTSQVEGAFFDHAVCFSGDEGVLSFHDVFMDEPLYISGRIPEVNIGRLCSVLGTSYTLVDNEYAF